MLAGMLAASGAAAQELSRAERLDMLFERLAAAESAEEAEYVEAEIWDVWTASGSPSIDLLLEHGVTALGEQAYDIAEVKLDALVELDPHFAEGWNQRAILYLRRDDPLAAIETIQRVLALEPRHFAALAGLGRLFDEMNNPRGALAAYRQAHAIHPHMEGLAEEIERLTIVTRGRDI
jgi:tetratricopeptide (TPR) repeat protein